MHLKCYLHCTVLHSVYILTSPETAKGITGCVDSVKSYLLFFVFVVSFLVLYNELYKPSLPVLNFIFDKRVKYFI